ncbi:MAG: hypothetical protein MUP74_05480, partial [Desulfobacterales bacterium]|nr:hypothetical protein [Desulfobacterales bacterium]
MEPFKRRIAAWAVLSFLWGAVFPAGAGAISIAEEEELAREVMNLVARQFEIIKDPLITAYVNRLGQKILAVLPSQPFTYHFYVLKEDVYNAFATPG